ncbi:MAG: hypothetical protein QOG53_2092 [Frankiales bacterium]|nr:hypothetical protein [Frankiales bacterium]
MNEGEEGGIVELGSPVAEVIRDPAADPNMGSNGSAARRKSQTRIARCTNGAARRRQGKIRARHCGCEEKHSDDRNCSKDSGHVRDLPRRLPVLLRHVRRDVAVGLCRALARLTGYSRIDLTLIRAGIAVDGADDSGAVHESGTHGVRFFDAHSANDLGVRVDARFTRAAERHAPGHVSAANEMCQFVVIWTELELHIVARSRSLTQPQSEGHRLSLPRLGHVAKRLTRTAGSPFGRQAQSSYAALLILVAFRHGEVAQPVKSPEEDVEREQAPAEARGTEEGNDHADDSK